MFSKFGKKFKFKENFIFNKTMLKTSSKKLGYKNNFGFSFSKQKKFFKKKIKKKNIFKKIKNLLFFLGLNSYCRVNNLFTRTNTVSLFNFKKANFLIINVYKRQFALKLQDVFISNYFNLTSCYFKGVNFFFCNYKKFYHFLFYYYFYNANCNYNCFLLNNFFKNLYNLRLVFDSYYKLSYVFYLSNRVFFFSDKPKKRLLSFYSGKGIKSQNKVKLRIKKWKNKVKPKFILFYLLVNVKLNLNPLAYLNKYKKTGKLIRSSKLKKRLAYKNLKNTLNLHYK